jgi:putative ATP-dependent endonuclease of OLD family
MRLTKLSLTGFRCFGPDAVTIDIDQLTAFVGANGAGKSAALVALVRMFGTTNAQRSLTREDFHLAASLAEEEPDKLELQLEAWFDFPELEGDEEAAASSAVPECLKNIVVGDSGPVPLCRIRLGGTWTRGLAVEGEIEQKLWWVNSEESEPPADKIHPLSGVERRLIQAFYVPAARDAVREPFDAIFCVGRDLDCPSE